MLQKFVQTVGGNPHRRQIEELSEEIVLINELEPQFDALSDEALAAKTAAFKSKLKSAGEGITRAGVPCGNRGCHTIRFLRQALERPRCRGAIIRLPP